MTQRPLYLDDTTGGVVAAAPPSASEVATFSFTGSLGLLVGDTKYVNNSGRTLTIAWINAAVSTAPTGSGITIDVNKNGTTVFTTQANRPTIAAGATSAGKRTNMDVTSLADGDYLTFDIDVIGSTVAGSGLTVQVGLAG